MFCCYIYIYIMDRFHNEIIQAKIWIIKKIKNLKIQSINQIKSASIWYISYVC